VLRCATWLAPGLPLGLFETVTATLGSALDCDVHLESRVERSGPDPDDDPFARDELDLGFMCTPSYRQLTSRTPASVRLVEAAPVFGDDRNRDRPVYFAELLVRDHASASTLADLAGARIGFNDDVSLSGLGALRTRMAELDLDESFATMVRTGGHRASLEMLRRGEIDAASIDSNTLLDTGAPDNVRLLETWGPFPIQPIVARAELADETRRVITQTLLALHRDAAAARSLRPFRVTRFAPVAEEDYR
jgi:ABC-type phosphate/phosphonate transport system substrate-binding protein